MIPQKISGLGLRLLLILSLILSMSACGVKGPPLPPIAATPKKSDRTHYISPLDLPPGFTGPPAPWDNIQPVGGAAR